MNVDGHTLNELVCSSGLITELDLAILSKRASGND